VALPDELYYGAALAAYRVGDTKRARQYCRKTTDIVATMQCEFQREPRPAWWEYDLAALHRQLDGAETPAARDSIG
jgi:hypothetical protein